TNLEERRLVAYHEGGHAIVARLTPGADPVHRVTIGPHGQALGVTEQRPDDDRRNYPRDYLMGRLAVMLGGRAAEDLVFGQPTTGAESDLKVATGLARRMVGLWGMTDEVGPVSYGVGETQPFLGRELAAPREYADATADRIDQAVVSIITAARDRATAIIRTARSASGSNSSRSFGIGSPLSIDRPYVPASIRASARATASNSARRLARRAFSTISAASSLPASDSPSCWLSRSLSERTSPSRF